MELSQLRYFIAVAKLGNMSKAAETLFVSQPNLSTSISRLEEEVGVPSLSGGGARSPSIRTASCC